MMRGRLRSVQIHIPSQSIDLFSGVVEYIQPQPSEATLRLELSEEAPTGLGQIMDSKEEIVVMTKSEYNEWLVNKLIMTE